MRAIIQREFINLFKSIKSILIVLFFLWVSYFIPKLFKNIPYIDKSDLSDTYTVGVWVIYTFLGFLFILLLSHDILNKEIENQTIRLLVTKMPRSSVVIGKFLGVLSFWFVSISLCFIIIFITTGEIFLFKLSQLLSFVSYPVALCILLSVVIRKTSLSIFIGLLLGFLVPIMGIWSNIDSRWFLYIFKYLTPYYYLLTNNLLSFVPIVFAFVMIFLSIVIIKKRDL